jgi:hypothetical protein
MSAPAKTLAFKKPYIAKILNGSKTSTIRRQTKLQPGDRVAATCEWGKPPFAILEVEGVDDARLHSLREDDAHADGFEGVTELRKALHDHYPGMDSFVRIRFSVVEPDSGE